MTFGASIGVSAGCIFVNFESVLNYELIRRPPTNRIETRISSMFNPKQPKNQNRTETELKSESENQKPKPKLKQSSGVGDGGWGMGHGVGGSGLKVFHRKSSETQPNSNNMFYTFLLPLNPHPHPRPLRLCEKSKSQKLNPIMPARGAHIENRKANEKKAKPTRTHARLHFEISHRV